MISQPFDCYQGLFVRQGQLGQQDMNVVNEVLLGNCYHTQLRTSVGPGEFVVDIGAHIGSFAHVWHQKNPLAKIACIEACPENLPVLQANVEQYAMVCHAACTYQPGELSLLNSVREGGTATGGSIVVSATQPDIDRIHPYWTDRRPLRKITLEEILLDMGGDLIHVLKLDCEGSEFSILSNIDWIDQHVRFICGEYHGRQRWDQLRTAKYSHWHFGDMKGGDLGIFHLANPRYLKG